MRFKEVRLKTKIFISVGVPLLVALIIGLIGITNINSIVESNKWVSHTYKVISAANEIKAHAIDMETGMRGYLLAGKEDFLEPYKKGGNTAFENIKNLQATVSDNPRQVLRLNEMKSILTRWITNVAKPNIDLRKKISDSKNMNEISELVGEARGKKYFDEFRTILDDFTTEETVLLKQREEMDIATVKKTVSVIIMCLVISILAGIFYAFFITRNIQAQVGGEPSVIMKLAENVAMGKLDFETDDKEHTGILAALNEVIIVINNILSNINGIVFDISSGKLDVSGDVDIFQGKWRDLVGGINSIIHNVTSHIDQIPMPFVTIDNDYNIQYLNKTGLEWVGKSVDKVIGQKCYENFHNSLCNTDKCYCAISLNTGSKQSGDLKLFSGKDVQYNTVPITNIQGQKSGSIMMYVDQTMIKKEDWVKTGLNSLNEKMSGDLDLVNLSKNIVGFLAEYLDIQVAAFYISENQELKLINSYAYKVRSNNYNSFKLGEGLVGQAALEQKSISFREIPDEHIHMDIISGLGDSLPKNISILPLVYEGETLGVIAIATTGDIDKHKREFLDDACANIAININLTQASVRLKDLLEETQVQAEELEQKNEELRASEESLQTQQEELRATNEEMTEKTIMLEKQKSNIKRSEEDMRIKAKKLKVATKYKSEFLANMSHELRTPLNAMLLLSKNLTKNKSKNLTEKQVKDADIIFKSGNDLLELINSILDLSKIEAGKKTVTPKEVYYETVTTNISNIFGEMLSEKGIDFIVKKDKNLPDKLITDQQKLEQIIKNLMSNALKFTEKGSIKLKFGRPDNNANMSRLNPKETVAISVSDTGKGIPEDKQSDVFEAFQQADGTIVRKYGGTGLGLTICRELTKILGGEVTLKSTEGKGSLFTFYIAENLSDFLNIQKQYDENIKIDDDLILKDVNIYEDDGLSISLPKHIQDDRGIIKQEDKIILIIEDDTSFAQVLLDYCHEKGFKCIHTVTGEKGLEISEKIPICAIILDLKLPGINGWGVLKKLKANIRTRHIPVHIMSVEEKPENILQKGVVGYLNKPVSNEDLNLTFNKINKLAETGIKKLMVVGDEPEVIEKLSDTFGSMGVEIETFKEGIPAFTSIKENKYDCVIIDLDLSDISGFDFLKKFDDINTKDLPAIIIHTDRELTEEECFELNKYASSMIKRSDLSSERLIDEVALFLHSIVQKYPGTIEKNLSFLDDDSLKDKKIMVVDDDVRNIYSIITSLEDYEIDFIKASNGVKALEEVSNNPSINLILMDIMMPEMDGYEAIKRIRKISGYENVPIIALTAKGMEKDKQLSFEAGATDYLMKPVDSDKLLSTIRIWLSDGR